MSVTYRGFAQDSGLWNFLATPEEGDDLFKEIPWSELTDSYAVLPFDFGDEYGELRAYGSGFDTSARNVKEMLLLSPNALISRVEFELG